MSAFNRALRTPLSRSQSLTNDRLRRKNSISANEKLNNLKENYPLYADDFSTDFTPNLEGAIYSLSDIVKEVNVLNIEDRRMKEAIQINRISNS